MSSKEQPSSPQSPVLRILQLTEQGMVFESLETFSVGSAVELGFHVQGGRVDAADEESRFITAEGLIVSNILCAAEDGCPLYELTLLFSSLTRKDRKALQRYSARQTFRNEEEESDIDPSLLEKGILGLN